MSENGAEAHHQQEALSSQHSRDSSSNSNGNGVELSEICGTFQDAATLLEPTKGIKTRKHRQETLVFSARISLALTTCSLFIFLDHPDPSKRVYPNATWIYIVACIVLWLPPQHPLDGASLTKQVGREMLGSIVAGALSIGCGFLALQIDNDQGRAVFMGCCIAVVSFLFSFVVVRFNLISGLSAQLGLLLFCTSLFPFLYDVSTAWQPSMYTIFNSWVGGVIAWLSSVVVFPRSTGRMLRRDLTDQMALVGECAELILRKARKVSQGDLPVRSLTSVLPETRQGPDPDKTHEAYDTFFYDSLESQSLVDSLPYDILGLCRDNSGLELEATRISSQAFLVVTTVMILDSCIQHRGMEGVNSETLEAISRLGIAIKLALDPRVCRETSQCAAEHLLLQVPFLHGRILQACANRNGDSTFVEVETIKQMLSRAGGTMPIYRGFDGNELFFFQLIEQLVVQSLRLHYVWNQATEVLIEENATESSRGAEHYASFSTHHLSTNVGSVRENGTVQPIPLDTGSKCAKETVPTSNEDGPNECQLSADEPISTPMEPSEEKPFPTPVVSDNIESSGVSDTIPATTNDDDVEVHEKRTSSWRNGLEDEAIRFGVRMSVSLTLSSLFVLLDSSDPSQRKYPQGEWVLVSAVVVAWFPSLDAASVLLKTLERVMGTITAAILGWSCGLIAVAIQDTEWRSVFMGFSMLFVTFGYAFIGYRSEVYTLWRYGSFVGLFTFGIVVFPFTDGDLDSWWTGLYRIVNTVIGALISCICALVIFPKSTRSMIQRRVTHQVEQAGVCVQDALSSCDDQAHDDAYKSILAAYQWSRELFYILDVDPFMKFGRSSKASKFREEAAVTLARVFRLQATANFLEQVAPLSRSNPKVLAQLGDEIAMLLSATNKDSNESDAVADDVLSELMEMRPLLMETRTLVSQSMNHDVDTTDLRKTLSSEPESPFPPPCGEASEHDLLGIILVEHMILRSLRLYYLWKQNTVCTAKQ